MWGLHKGRPLRTLAREISEVTGQPIPSTRRRLQEMEKEMQEQGLAVKSARRRPQRKSEGATTGFAILGKDCAN